MARALARAARGLASRAAFEEALAHPATVASPAERAEVLVAMAGTLEPGEAEAAATEALETARRLELGGVQVAALTRRADARLRAGRAEDALADARLATELLGEFTPGVPEGEVLATYARALAGAGSAEAAKQETLARDWYAWAARGLPDDLARSLRETFTL